MMPTPMAKALPVTLWRSVLSELWRLLLLSVRIIVLVLAFAGAVKPLADGKLQPTEVLKFIGFLVPLMLACALPFAGYRASLAQTTAPESCDPGVIQ